MAEQAYCTIAGVPVPVDGYGKHTWFSTLGTGAPEVIWALPGFLVDKLIAIESGETEIVFQLPGGQSKTWKRVVIVREVGSDDPLIRKILLSDVRWYLPRAYVKADYNVRSYDSATEFLNVAGVPIETLKPTNIQTYAPYSLKGATESSPGTSPNSADDILSDVQARIVARLANRGIKLAFGSEARTRGDYIPNDIMIDGPGDVSLGHAMAAAGGVDCKVSRDGLIVLVNAFLGAEKDTVEKACPYSIDGRGGPMRWIDMGRAAPSGVNTLYTRKAEVRADLWEQSPVGTVTPVDMKQLPLMFFVVQVSDQQLSVPAEGEDEAGTAVLGSFLPVDQYFAATNATPPAPLNAATNIPWSRQGFLDHYCGTQCYFAFAVDPTGSTPPSVIWSNRIGMARRDVGLTARLNPAFAALCVPGSIEPVRAQLQSAALGLRAPSPVFMDYARRPTVRGMQGDRFHGWNNHTFPPQEDEPIEQTKIYDETFPDELIPLTSLEASPFNLDVWDSIQGIFHFEAKKDLLDNTAELVPRLVYGLPAVSVHDAIKNSLNLLWEQAKAVYTARVATVFSATPAAAPLHRYNVTASQALERLGVDANAVKARGPEWDVRVGPNLQEARIAYGDASRAQNLALFTNPADPVNPNGATSLVPVNDAECADYAISNAAALLAAYLNHYEGHADQAFAPDAEPLGALVSVAHTIDEEGGYYTTLDCRHTNPPIQPIHLMDASARAVFFRSPTARAGSA